jgi:hypothetical protein
LKEHPAAANRCEPEGRQDSVMPSSFPYSAVDRDGGQDSDFVVGEVESDAVLDVSDGAGSGIRPPRVPAAPSGKELH